MHRKKSKSAKGAPYLGGSRGMIPRKFLNLGSWKCHLLCFPQAIFSNPRGFCAIHQSGLNNSTYVQYHSKVSWHSILDPYKNQELRIESRINSLLLRLDSWFSIPASLIKPGMAFVKFQVICSLLLILDCSKDLQPLFKFWVIFSHFSHFRKIFLLYKITIKTLNSIWLLREIPELCKFKKQLQLTILQEICIHSHSLGDTLRRNLKKLKWDLHHLNSSSCQFTTCSWT